MDISQITKSILAGDSISKTEALALVDAPLEELCCAANDIREHCCGNRFDLCTIINAKSGRCSENCAFCAQSAHYHTAAEVYPLRTVEAMTAQAQADAEAGTLRFSMVTSGRFLTMDEVEQVCAAARQIRAATNVSVCVSAGLVDEADFEKLKTAGVTRIHCNLETSRNYFSHICTTHTYDDKIKVLQAAQEVGLEVCSGGIVGMGESFEDRIDMAFTLRDLGVKSVPVNMLNPIAGTPLEHQVPLSIDEMRRVVAIFRFILPDAEIRLAGGRGLMQDHGAACFTSGANAAISGDMLTTAGYSLETDHALLADLGYVVCRA